MDTELTQVDSRLLDVLKSNGDWMTRSDIDAAVGNLSPYHISRLERLANLGLIKLDYKIRGFAQRVFLYRAV